MGVTVAELLSRIDSRELSEWMAFYKLEPWGDERADLRIAILASLYANANRKKGQAPFKPSDFIPRFEPPEEQPPEQMKAFLHQMGKKNK